MDDINHQDSLRSGSSEDTTKGIQVTYQGLNEILRSYGKYKNIQDVETE